MEEKVEIEAEELQPVQFESVVLNSIRHSFEILDEANSGKVAKSQLQVLCAGICLNIGATHDAQNLTNFKHPSTSLSFQDFVQYLHDHLRVTAQAEIDCEKIHQLCWKIVEQKFQKSGSHLLSFDAAFKQFIIFNILDIEETSKVEKEEIAIVLEKFVHAMGQVWNPKPMQEFCEGDVMTFWQYIQCLEEKYIFGNDPSVVDEALEEVVDHVVNEVIKQGYLVKKGHKMKSLKERWFVLKPTNLSYFVNNTCTERKGVITLNMSSAVESVPAKGRYKFTVKCGETKIVYELEAKDQKSRLEWIASIQAAIDTSGGPSPQKKERLQRSLNRKEKRQQHKETEKKQQEQETLLLEQKEELARLQELCKKVEVQAAVDAALLQAEISKREELERLQAELKQLLETERRAKEEEEQARANQEKLLEEERKRTEEVERLREEQEKRLQDEMKMREDLEEQHKQKEKMLEEERRLLKQLEEERLAAERAMKAVQEKLAAAEQASKKAAEQAKKKARELKTAVGLARTVGPAVPSWVSHRGPGAFCESDFDAKPLAEKTERKGLEKSDENGKGEESRTDGDQDKSQQETAAAEKIEANGAIEAKAEESGVHEGQKTSEEVAASE
ncbi:switch-associated protein 70-like isoform X1 [Acropora palmata]|uniref:switch-associated protein 70-like isoform X1 n=2 Tax=Acropora palmata TaxID=6131 RepID=UPI003DA00A3D